MRKELDLFKDFKLEDFCKEQEERELDEAKREVEDIFRKYVQMTDKISIATIQRKLRIGYAKASNFVELLALKNIVSDKFGVRDIYDKEKLVEEAITYFPKIIRDRNRLNELNDYNMYVFAVKNHFGINNVDYYWLVRLITENFAKDDEFVKTIDEIFGTKFKTIKDVDKRAQKIISNNFYMDGLLPVVTLQYFAEKLKHETLKNCDYMNENFKEKIRNLRFFKYEY